jgi:hypothetical protein
MSPLDPKHTPGPWVASTRDWMDREVTDRIYIHGDEYEDTNDDEDDDDYGSVTTVGTAVCFVDIPTNGTQPAWANARLIAAAPDLYDVCKEVLDKLDYLTGLWGQEAITRRLQDRVREVVARVDGGTEGGDP